jgi:hypothetical protein
MEDLTAKLIPIAKDSEAIILLHGLARTSRSMNKTGEWLAIVLHFKRSGRITTGYR